MKSDARLFIKKKQTVSGGWETWKTQNFKSRGYMDARKILNERQKHKSKNTVFGSYMRTKTATDFIASQIRKEISPGLKGPEKKIKLSNDGNIIITAKSKNPSQAVMKRSLLQQMEFDLPSSSQTIQSINLLSRPSTSDMDDLEHTAVEDLLDMESLPPAYVSSKTIPAANLSRNPRISEVLENRSTMIADQFSRPPKVVSAKVYVSNLHPSVSQQDLMELFGDIGVIKDAEMLMPGTAIVDFYNAQDAERACENYHNRLLDGMPMKCYLQTQKPQPQRPTISQRLGNRIVAQPPPLTSPVTKTSLSSVTNSRFKYNSRNVQFTVKLS